MDLYAIDDEENKMNFKKIGGIFFIATRLLNGILLSVYAHKLGSYSWVAYIGAMGWLIYFADSVLWYITDKKHKKLIEEIKKDAQNASEIIKKFNSDGK